jgi:glycosyltransferase involved in cell wall biosynthesis
VAEIMISNPAITIILSFKDGGNFLHLALDSIINQSFQNWELIIFDNGSKDNSHLHVQNIDDDRIRFIRFEKTEYLSVRLNQGIDLARGKYIARMDHDDICFLDRLLIQYEFLEANTQYDLVASNCLLINKRNELIGSLYEKQKRQYHSDGIIKTFPYPHPTWMGKTSWFKKYYYKNKPQPYLCEDQELLFRSHSESSIIRLDSTLLAYRVSNKYNIITQWRRYLAILCFQVPSLFKSKNLHLMLLSIAIFFLRLINSLHKFLNISPLKKIPFKPTNDIELRWNKVITTLEKNKVEN